MLIDDLNAYCHELTGHPVAVVPDADANGRLPMFLTQLYEPHRAELFGQPWTLLLFRRRNTPTPAEVAGHARAANQALGQEVVFVFPKLASYERNRLVQKGLRFIVPYSQVFLPGAMVALKEQQAPADIRPARAVLSAPAQLLVLFHLQRHETKEPLPLCGWATLLGYSRMTLTRVCDELAQAGLAQKVGRGKVVVIELAGDSRELWEKAAPRMASPVMKRIHVRWRGNRPASAREAGLTALAKVSDLAPGKESVVAMTPATFREVLSHHLLEPEPYAEPETAEVELWRYEPGLLSMDGNTVDPLSLYLSLRGTSDERIEAALAGVLKGIKW
jgi:DNA-binding MarR family transcriptional regulator